MAQPAVAVATAPSTGCRQPLAGEAGTPPEPQAGASASEWTAPLSVRRKSGFAGRPPPALINRRQPPPPLLGVALSKWKQKGEQWGKGARLSGKEKKSSSANSIKKKTLTICMKI